MFYLAGKKLKVVLAKLSSLRLGVFVVSAIACHIRTCASLELKPLPMLLKFDHHLICVKSSVKSKTVWRVFVGKLRNVITKPLTKIALKSS